MADDEKAFLNAIALHPEDATARGVFADWLDEHDQPQRAAWFRAPTVRWLTPVGTDRYAPYPATDAFGPSNQLPTADVLALCGVPPGWRGAMIRVWAFHEAPEVLQSLTNHGGDEDWLLLCSEFMTADRWMPWADSGTGFGVCQVDEHRLPDNWVVRIGAHAQRETLW